MARIDEISPHQTPKDVDNIINSSNKGRIRKHIISSSSSRSSNNGSHNHSHGQDQEPEAIMVDPMVMVGNKAPEYANLGQQVFSASVTPV